MRELNIKFSFEIKEIGDILRISLLKCPFCNSFINKVHYPKMIFEDGETLPLIVKCENRHLIHEKAIKTETLLDIQELKENLVLWYFDNFSIIKKDLQTFVDKLRLILPKNLIQKTNFISQLANVYYRYIDNSKVFFR